MNNEEVLKNVKVLNNEKTLNDEKAPKDVDDVKAKKKAERLEELLKRQKWISTFCDSLITCTIVGPSVLWIKVYITLKLIAYMIDELLKKVKDLRNNKKNRSSV